MKNVRQTISRVFLACVAGTAGATSGADAAPPPRPEAHVLILGIDGTRADALAKAKTPHLDELIRQGSFSDTVQILGTRYDKNDTISGPSWSSILTGVWADKHGVHDNSFKGRNYELFPHFFKHLKQIRPDATAVSLASWEPIHSYILSEADVAEVLPLPVLKNQIRDLRKNGNDLQVNTRDGAWHHLAATREQGTLRLYLDGKPAGDVATGNDQFSLSGPYWYLGRDTRSNDVCFQGQLDDVRIWKRALSAEELTRIAAGAAPAELNRSGLLSEYLFETSTPYRDTASHPQGPFHAEPVANTGTVKVVKETRLGKETQAVDLTTAKGKDHGLRIPLSPGIADVTKEDFTVEVWFKTQDEGRGILLGNYQGQKAALNLELHESNTVRVYHEPENVSPAGGLTREIERDAQMARRAADILKNESPDAMFVYFHQVDATGHGIGFSPEVPEYLSAIENVDANIGTVLSALRNRPNYEKENWLVIVCTDHGGIKRTHGNGHKLPEIRQVFMIFGGPAARQGTLTEQVYLVDVAATALTHLTGPISPKLQLDGKAVGLKELPTR